jgi:ABC-type thiamine transport system substrate-binding protein
MITYQKMTISLLIVLAAAGFFAGHLWPAEKKLPWQENWDKTVAAAKNEGQLTVYGSRGYEIHFRDFQKKYPDIKVTTVLGRGAEIGAKLMSERRAGKYLADIYAGGTNTLYLVLYQNKALDPIRTVLLLPEVLDESKWWRGKHHYNDTEGQFIFIFEGSVQTGRIAYNTQLVDPNQVKSYWDLLNPKWKGKIVSNDPGRGGESTQSLRILLSQSAARSRFHLAALYRDGCDYQPRFSPDRRLAGDRQIFLELVYRRVSRYPPRTSGRRV